MPKYMIVNADDLGLSRAVNRGIVKAHREGILSSASLLANGPAFEDALQVAQDNPRLAVGAHLNVLRGRPVAEAARVELLLDDEGRFDIRMYDLWWQCRQREVFEAIEAEYRAQIERLLDAGLRLSHLDSEKHHAVWKPLDALLVLLAKDYGIPAVRCLREPAALALRSMPWPGVMRAVRASLLRTYVTLNTPAGGVKRPDFFFGQTHIGRMDEAAWVALLAALPEGVSEVMTHPGEADDAEEAAVAREMGKSWIDSGRPVELAALCSEQVRAATIRHGVQVFAYSSFG